MTKYTPPSIKSQGFENFLNKHAGQHRGFGYQIFVILYRDARLNITNLARAFNVSRETIKKYIAHYEDEGLGR